MNTRGYWEKEYTESGVEWHYIVDGRRQGEVWYSAYPEGTLSEGWRAHAYHPTLRGMSCEGVFESQDQAMAMVEAGMDVAMGFRAGW